MNRRLALTSLLLAGLLICDPSAAQTTRPKPMLGKFEIFYKPARSGYIDTKGKVVIEKDFRPYQFRSFSSGLAAISQEPADIEKQRWGFIDKKGKAVVAQNYSRAGDFSDGLAAVAPPMTPRQVEYLKVSRLIRRVVYIERPDHLNQTPDNGWWEHEYGSHGQHASLFGPWGFIDETGKVVIPLSFNEVRGFREGLAYAKGDSRDKTSRGETSGFIDKSGKWVIRSRDRTFTGDFSEGFATFYKSGKNGCIDRKGNVVIPPKFYTLRDFSNGRAAFMTENQDFGFIDKTGTVVIKARYKNVRPFSEGLAGVLRKSKWGYIDVSGRTVIPFRYEQALGFSCGLAAVNVDGKWGYIDRKGKIVIAPQFAGASMFRDDRAKVNIGGGYYRPYADSEIGYGGVYRIANGAWRYIDKSGEFISKIEFDNALDFRDGLAAFKIFKKLGLKDASDRIVLPAQLDWIDSKFVGGMAKVRSRGRFGFINASGKLTVRPVLVEVGDFAKGPAAAKAGKLWGHVNRDGKFVVKPQFDDALSFSEQLAAVQFPPVDKRKDAKWGYIDATGKTVLKPVFEAARSFSESLAAVRVDGRFGYIDKSGKTAIQPQFQDARDFNRGLAVVCRMGLDGLDDARWGAIDKKGQYVIPAVFPREPKIENGVYVFKSKDLRTGRFTKCPVDRQGIVRDGGKSLGTVAKHLLPSLLETLGKGDQQRARSALCAMSAIGGDKALKALRDSIVTSDAYTCRLAAAALGRATGQDALDILLKQMGGDEAKFADWASEAVMLMISEPRAAAAFLKKKSTVPKKYRERLSLRAAMAVAIGPRVQKAWRSYVVLIPFQDMEISRVFQFIRDVTEVTDSSIFIDWRGLAELSIEPATTINVQLPSTTMARVWDEILADLGDSRIDCITVGGITIVSTRDRLAKIVRVLSARPAVGRGEPEKNNTVAKLLQGKVSRFDFEDMELSQVLQFCRDVSGAKIEVDWKSLAQLGVEPETPVRVNVRNITLDTALKLALISAAGPGKLTYKIDAGKIRITRTANAPIPPLPSPVAILTESLYTDRELRLRAAEALGDIGPPAKTAIGALTKMLKDKDKGIRKAAADAIEKINKALSRKRRT